MKKIFLISILFLLTPFVVKGEIRINEIAWMGTENSPNDEWIELYSDQQIDLTGWTLEAMDETPSINLEGIISANGYFLLERSDDNSVPDLAADQIYTSALKNSGEYLKLKDNNGSIIDEINASDRWLAGDNFTKQTMERIANGWQTSLNPGGTPKAPNSSGAVSNKPKGLEKESKSEPKSSDSGDQTNNKNTSYSEKIIISEFIPNPVGKDAEEEWIEIYNNSEQVVDISGWQLDDEQDGSKPFVFPENTLIIPKGYLVFPRQTTKIALNNNGDKVRLLLPNGTLFQEITYTKAPEGQSSSRTSEGFVWTTPTPGLPNKSEAASQLSTKLSNQKSEHKSSKQIQQNHYNLANLKKSTGNSNKLILVIITITVIALTVGMGFIKFKKKKY